MEAAIENKGVSTKHRERTAQTTNKYRKYRDGAPPRSETIEIVERVCPEASLRYWAQHPIGILLLSPQLSHQQIIDLIEVLPDGEARRMMWFQRGKTRAEVPDSEELIEELVLLQSIDGLIVILGRLRLRLLLGQTDDIDLYEHGVLDCFPEVIAKSLHLSVARYSLMQALSDFLDWQCGWAESHHEIRDGSWGAEAGNFWPLLWQRFEDAAQNSSSAWSLALDAQLVLQQQQMNERIELR